MLNKKSIFTSFRPFHPPLRFENFKINFWLFSGNFCEIFGTHGVFSCPLPIFRAIKSIDFLFWQLNKHSGPSLSVRKKVPYRFFIDKL